MYPVCGKAKCNIKNITDNASGRNDISRHSGKRMCRAKLPSQNIKSEFCVEISGKSVHVIVSQSLIEVYF